MICRTCSHNANLHDLGGCFSPADGKHCPCHDTPAALIAAERDALLAKFEALAEAWCRPGHESCLRINCADCMGNDFAAHLTAVIKEARA